jgi:NAD(P)H-hydrate epimerase
VIDVWYTHACFVLVLVRVLEGPPRAPFTALVTAMTRTSVPVLSIDLPSGWDVELGDIHKTGFYPNAVVSLTVPKLCMKGYSGDHYVGGRFVPPHVRDKFHLTLPVYAGVDQVAKLSSSTLDTSVSECHDGK